MDEPILDTIAPSDMEEVYRREGPRVWRALVLHTRDPEIASDAAAEAFAQALARGDELRSPERWIWTVAFRVANGHLKERGRNAGPPIDRAVQAPPELLELTEALSRLSPRQRASVILHYFGGYGLREIAGMLGSSTAAIGVHLHRARARLRDLLEDDHA